MEIKVENFTINIYRAEASSHEEEIKRLANYVYTICELGKQQQELVNKVAVATERLRGVENE
jgi:hypothetical protein